MEAMEKLTPAFWKWFGDSNVVDEDGQPLVVYHGTTHDFTKFDQSKGDLGWHFGSKSQAKKLIKHKGLKKSFVMPVYLSIKNPIEMEDIGNWDDRVHVAVQMGNKKSLRRIFKDTGLLEFEEIRTMLEDAGYDGIEYQNLYEGDGASWIPFRPNQIKSAVKNDGSFNADDDDIRSNPAFHHNDDEDKNWGRDEYFARLEDAMRSSVKEITTDAADFPIVRLTRKDGMQLIVHQTSQSGKSNWQVSWLDKNDIPSMHTLFKTRGEALRSIAGAGGGESIGVPGEWHVVETRNIRNRK